MRQRTREERRLERALRAARWILGIVAAGIIALCLLGAEAPAEETPTARERAAGYAAQARYYEVLDRYGDMEGAVQAAELVYKDRMEEAAGQ